MIDRAEEKLETIALYKHPIVHRLTSEVTVVSFDGDLVGELIKMMEFKAEQKINTIVIIIGTLDVSGLPLMDETEWEPMMGG